MKVEFVFNLPLIGQTLTRWHGKRRIVSSFDRYRDELQLRGIDRQLGRIGAIIWLISFDGDENTDTLPLFS